MKASAVSRSSSLIIGFGAALILLGIGWPILEGEVYTHSDLASFHLPMRLFYADALREGTGFLWYPYSYAGFHLHGEGQAAMFHPANRLLYGFLPFQLAFGLDLLRNFVLLFLGGVGLLRHFDVRLEASLLGSLLFAFGAFTTVHFMHLNVMAIVAHAPWVAWAADTALMSRRRETVAVSVVGIALLIASELMFGHPQFVWLGGIPVAALVAYRVGTGADFGRLAWIVLAVAIGCLIAAAQLLPQWESLEASFRHDPATAFIETLSLQPLHMTVLAAPYIWARDPYINFGLVLRVSALVPVLLAWLIVRWPRLGDRRRVVLILVAGTVLAIIVALGDATLLGRGVSQLPIVGLFRAPYRYILIAQIGFSALAAVSFAALVRDRRDADRPPASRLAWLVLAPLGSLLVVVGVLEFSPPNIQARALSGTIGLVASVAVPTVFALAVGLVGTGRRWILPLLLLCVAFEIGSLGLKKIHEEETVSISDHVESLGPAPPSAGERVSYPPQANVLLGLRLVRGYSALVPDRRLPIFKAVMRPHAKRRLSPAIRQSMRIAGAGWAQGQPIDEPMPRVRLVGESVEETDLVLQVATLDIERVAIVDRPLSLGGRAPGRILQREEHAGYFGVEVDASGRQLLVVAEAFHPGWKAAVDDAPVTIVRAYGDFMGIEIPDGEHRVDLRFDPDSVRHGRVVSVVGLALCVPLGILVWRYGASDAPHTT